MAGVGLWGTGAAGVLLGGTVRALMGVLCLTWAVVGAYAGEQREIYGQGISCDAAITTAATVAAGPLNYYGVDPALRCPEPS